MLLAAMWPHGRKFPKFLKKCEGVLNRVYAPVQNRSLSGEIRSLSAFQAHQSPKTAMPSILFRFFLPKTLFLPAFAPVQSLETPMPTAHADTWHAHAVKLQNSATPKHALQRHPSQAKSATPTDTRLSGQAPLETVIIIDFQRLLTGFFQGCKIFLC